MQKINTQSGFSGVPVLLGVLALVIVGASGFYVFQKNSDNKQVASINESTELEKLTPLPVDLSVVKPVSEIQASVTLAEGVTVQGVELEQEEGKLVYKVKLSDSTVLLFDAVTGVKIDKPTSVENEEEDGSVSQGFTAAISITDARQIALQSAPGKEIRKIKLESEHGVIVYSIRFTDKTRIDIDATTGTVTTKKSGNDDSNNNSSDSSSGSGSSVSSSHDDNDSEDSNDDNDDDNSSNNSGQSSSSATTSISLDQARTIALGARPGQTIEKVEQETEEGVAVYSFRFVDNGRVDVRKSDGAVVRVQN